jgi:hypothetical protein
MKLRFGLTALCISAAAMSGAINLYNLHKLPDHGLGGRARHIASWGRHLAMAVGYVDDTEAERSAQFWPQITAAGPGPGLDLPTPDPTRPSTAASYIQLLDGRYMIVGQWTEPSGMRRSSIWLNSTAEPLTYNGMALPQVPTSTGSEAHDIINVPGGGVVIVGHDWPVIENGPIVWIASVWRISPTGQVQETILPKPPGTGWSKALSVGQDISQPGLLSIVGSVQEVPGGPWRACMWRFNPATGQSTFRNMGSGPLESYGYRISPSGANSVGWLEDANGTEFSAFWAMRQGFPQTNLNLMGRLYGINDGGYYVGALIDNLSMRDGLIGNVRSSQGPFEFSGLVRDWGGLTAADHLYCVAADGQVAGCTTIVPGVSYQPLAGVPTGDHGPDTYGVSRGQITGETPAVALMQIDNKSLDIRAQQGRIILDTAIFSAPIGFDDAEITVALTDPGTTNGQLLAFNWSTHEYESAALPFSFGVSQPVTGYGWATFPSSWRSSSGEVRFRLILEPQMRRDIVKINAITFRAG